MIQSTRSFCFIFVMMFLFDTSFSPISAQQATTVSSVNRLQSNTEHPLDPALEMAEASLQHVRADVRDYRALFVKRCRVDGVLPELQYAQVKIRNRKVDGGQITTPLSVYLNFLKPDAVAGREVIWVEGQNEGRMVAHESGLKGMINVNLDPNGYLAMRGQRHPITDIGIENLLVKLIETGQRERQYGECEVQFYPNAKIKDIACTMLQVVHPVKRPHFEFYTARVYFDNEQRMPIRYESWSWPTTAGGDPVLEEEYTYLDVKVNEGMTNLDFDIRNPAYQFR
ncbi:DUF1571 domain-containing protein [Novipirellula artificiosorum]|uniref:DUF1571 domain-containing protein n=1 Tax=Novipirellula artificiosorum TaxID=2528016 RepID=A0A5C6E302_9BACT|nr:DUF1571 domain-containing protein [Novipirellula artificiosorum]TWU41766.1 hypothetical protein Poly41_00580 [Novipirellula artificiosorum]